MVNRIAESIPFIASNSSQVSSTNEASEKLVPKTIIEDYKPSLLQKEEDQNPLPAEKAKKMTESINRFMETTNTNLRFQFHEELKEYYVTIVDSKTNELVKEIPSKKLMDIYAAMRDFLGLMVDHKI
ncbi:MAG: flagellar protein FlaG [Firmicutes bacterium]|nr:flagellar protein FlaG [Bacillota bacterium]